MAWVSVNGYLDSRPFILDATYSSLAIPEEHVVACCSRNICLCDSVKYLSTAWSRCENDAYPGKQQLKDTKVLIFSTYLQQIMCTAIHNKKVSTTLDSPAARSALYHEQ